MKLTIALKLVFALAVSVVHADVPDELECNHPRVIARLPPSFGPPNPKFKYPPPGYFSGLFFQTYSSINDTTLDFRNIQLLSVFEHLSGITYDLTSYQLGECDHIYTIFGEHTNTGDQADKDQYEVVEPGTNITHIQDIIAYGFDTECHRYFVLYGKSPGTPGVLISSSVIHGPTDETVAHIKKALIKLGNEELSDAVRKIAPVLHDGRRNGLADYICGEKCMVNNNSPPADGSCPDGHEM